MIWNSVSEIWKFYDPKSFSIAYFRYFYLGKAYCFGSKNSKRTPIELILLPLDSFFQDKQLSFEHFLKFAPKGLRMANFRIDPNLGAKLQFPRN